MSGDTITENNTLSVFKGSAIIFFITIISSLFGYFIRISLAKQLSLADFGLFFGIFTFINFIWIFKHFGLNNALIKFIPEFIAKKSYQNVASAISCVLILELIFAGIIALFLWLISGYLSVHYYHLPSAKSVLLLLTGYFILSVFTDITVSAFLGFKKYFIYALYLLLQNIFVLIFILCFTQKWGILSPALGYLITSLVLSVLFIILFLKEFNLFRFKSLLKDSNNVGKSLLSYGFALTLGMFGGKIIGYIDVLILTYFRSLEEVGIYNAVLPTALLLTVLGGSLALVIVPVVSEFNAKLMKNELLSIIAILFKYTFMIAVPICSFFLLFSGTFLNIFFGELYVAGAVTMQLLLVGVLFYSIAQLNIGILNGFGNPKSVTKIILISALISVIFNIILIPLFGIVGAAISTSLSYIFTFIASTFKLSKFTGLIPPWILWIKTLFCGLIAVIVSIILKNYISVSLWADALIVCFIFCGIYLCLLFLLRLINYHEMCSLIKIIFKR